MRYPGEINAGYQPDSFEGDVHLSLPSLICLSLLLPLSVGDEDVLLATKLG